VVEMAHHCIGYHHSEGQKPRLVGSPSAQVGQFFVEYRKYILSYSGSREIA